MTTTTFDLGDVVTLPLTVKDAAGTAIDATSVSLFLTDPTGATVDKTSSIVHDGTGTYHADLSALTIVGRYIYRWVTTGTGQGAYSDIFHLLPADPRFLISLAEAREQLRKTTAATADDEEIRLYVAAVTTIVEDIAGPQAGGTQQVTRSGGRGTILLPTSVTAITSITENGVTLTAGSDYVADTFTGIVYRGTQRQPFAFISGQDNIVITYTNGDGIVEPNVRLAARLIFKHLWQADNQGQRPQYGSNDDGTVAITPGGYAVPRRAVELLASSVDEMPGFA